MRGLHFGAMLALVISAPVLARPIGLDDLARLKTVGAPAIDPAGEWVAYTVGSVDVAKDRSETHIWMSRWDGSRSVQLTARPGESESTPRFSPDGRTIAFISSRADEKERDRLWLMSRDGGEARVAADLAGSVVDYAWAPDSKRIALIVADPDPAAAGNAAAQGTVPQPPRPGDPETPGVQPDAKGEGAGAFKDDEERPKPIVIDRFHFKQDIDGYLGKQRQRLMLLDLATGAAHRMTSGDFDEHMPVFSPDGSRVAFVSNRDADPDRSFNFDIFTVAAAARDAEPNKVTSFAGADNDPDTESYPAWSPDGKQIAYLQGGPDELVYFGMRKLAVAPADGGPARLLTERLDRNVSNPVWSADGKSIRLIVEDDGIQWLGRVPATGGAVTPVSNGRRVIEMIVAGGKGRTAVQMTDPMRPSEIYALEGGNLRPLSRQNEAWLKDVTLAPVSETRAKSADGTEVGGFLTRAPSASGPQPALLRIHGGPTSQYDMRFMFEWQLFAANGYAVIASNPRGSTGRGLEYSKAIFAAWGSVDVPDVLAAVDDAVARGIADPARLGVGGWSYGGMLTNYVIASDTRFKAATSGASISNVLAGYGTDQYIREYELELGKPWETSETWMRVSYPFFQNQKIVTPTLFLVGQQDWNVPLIATEQMYQALKSRGVDTQMVIYPGEHHGLKRPSFVRDRLQRYLDWYAARLK